MFLPVLLVQQFGAIGWVIFAVPNVIGAAAMGWVLGSGADSQEMVQRHRTACVVFSLVTIAFQLYFVKLALWGAWGSSARLAVVAIVVACYFFGRFRPAADHVVAVLVWFGSILLLGLMFLKTPVHLAAWIVSPTTPADLAGLAAVCVFGFALCPYLDLTFHRARQACSVPDARFAFGVGFGVIFFAMIVGSLLYSASIPAAGSAAIGFLVGHFVIQIAFTVGAHHAEIRRIGPAWLRRVEQVIVIAALVWFVSPVFLPQINYRGMSAGEIGYRLFMGFYGLVFPVYVWVAIVPHRQAEPIGPKFQQRVLIVTILACAPFFWLGFIEKSPVWLIPGVAIAILAIKLPVAFRRLSRYLLRPA